MPGVYISFKKKLLIWLFIKFNIWIYLFWYHTILRVLTQIYKHTLWCVFSVCVPVCLVSTNDLWTKGQSLKWDAQRKQHCVMCSLRKFYHVCHFPEKLKCLCPLKEFLIYWTFDLTVTDTWLSKKNNYHIILLLS